MSLILELNKPQVAINLDSFTFTVPADGVYNVAFLATVPAAPAEGYGAGSGQGHGAGAGGGFVGFIGGAFGPGFGGVGQGFGPSDNYAHSLPDVKTPSSFPPVTSLLSVAVKVNAVTIYTTPALGETQSAFEFKLAFPANANDVIEIVPSSLAPFDVVAKMTASVNQGL